MPFKINFVGSSLTEFMLVGAYSYINKLISGKRESVSWPHSKKIDEQWEC